MLPVRPPRPRASFVLVRVPGVIGCSPHILLAPRVVHRIRRTLIENLTFPTHLRDVTNILFDGVCGV